MSNRNRKILFILLFLIAFVERVYLDLGDNVELITASLVLASYFLGGKTSFVLTFIIIALSDLILGNTNIFLFTWSGFLIPALFSRSVLHTLEQKFNKVKKHTTLGLVFTGISANAFFFIWTNFGVWLLDSWGMYSNDVAGLATCYLRGLPFLKNQLLSTLFFVPSGYFVVEKLFTLQPKLAKIFDPKFG